MRPGNRVFSGPLVGVSFVGALDAYNVVLAVSSARRLLTSYTGSIARIRSTGAGTPELDFGYDAAGVIDTAGIASFLGADSGVFRYLYDQKGTNHFGQSSAASQPAYNASGLNNRPTAQFDGSNDGLKTVGSQPDFLQPVLEPLLLPHPVPMHLNLPRDACHHSACLGHL